MTDMGSITAAWIDRGAAEYEQGERDRKWHPGPKLMEHLQKKPALRQLRADLEHIHYYWDLETYLLGTVGPAALATGHYTAAGFLPVCYWKSPRALRWQIMNRNSVIESKSTSAFRNDQPWTVLDTLVGVGVPTASALLTICEPRKYTILDVRAIDALADAGVMWDGRPFRRNTATLWNARYRDYLACCHAIARHVGRELRTVDRALWHYGG